MCIEYLPTWPKTVSVLNSSLSWRLNKLNCKAPLRRFSHENGATEMIKKLFCVIYHPYVCRTRSVRRCGGDEI